MISISLVAFLLSSRNESFLDEHFATFISSSSFLLLSLDGYLFSTGCRLWGAAVAVMGRSTPSLCAGLSKRLQIPVILLGSLDVMSCMGLGRSDWGLSYCCCGGGDPLSPCIWCVGVVTHCHPVSGVWGLDGSAVSGARRRTFV